MAMSKQRIGATNTSRPGQTIRPTYEDFQPQFELKEDDEAHIIHVQLPGFLKEQVKITFVHAARVIRVHGQRPLGNNRWSRFNQTFPLPQNCHESEIHATFNNGVLTITLPKEVIPKTDPEKKKVAAVAKPIQETDPKTVAAEAKPQNKVHLREEDQVRATPPQKPVVEPKVQKGQDTTHQPDIATAAKDPQIATSELETQKGLPLTNTKDHNVKEAGAEPHAVSAMTQNEKQREEKRVIVLSSAATQPKPQKSRDEIPPKTMADKTSKAYNHKEIQDRYTTEENEKQGEPNTAESVVDSPLNKEKEMIGERSRVAAVIEKITPNTLDKVNKKSKRFGSGVEQEKPGKNNNAAREGMRNLDKWINDEEKQLLINVGAAVLVLAAFGAYTTYSLWCPGRPKN